ncbi:DNA polymerase III subunit delta' [Simiduia aestuariiviva]|uniref:DNA polymerase III subunit delta' n=1 Tax=Simiduia aestuariiviva TaxID=1510459 RepID=A0A839UN84_9GAMM|nr:DNA polymerase III subunit delta' [Simiduia aestuariiviva]MBB3168211.1 DNA polymerase-3 subunit delta' [Simiduia aestuariiviva]
MTLAETEFGLSPFPWQGEQWSGLYKAIEQSRLPHAYLFSGIAGVGKAHMALLVAHRLMCSAQSGELACGHCKACQLVKAGSHPDLLLVEPEAHGKAIKIDPIRKVTDFLAKTAQQGGRKVVVLAPAEAMTTAAANALLKSLEEPAGNSHLLLVSHQASGVLSTIRSRCRLLTFGQPPVEQVLPWLTPLVGSRTDPAALLELAGGAPLYASDLLEGENLEHHQALMSGLEALALGQTGPLTLASQWQAQDPIQLLTWIQVWLSQLLRQLQWQVKPGANSVDWALQMLGRGDPAILHRYYEKVGRARSALAGGANPNPQLLLEELVLDWQALCRAMARR